MQSRRMRMRNGEVQLAKKIKDRSDQRFLQVATAATPSYMSPTGKKRRWVDRVPALASAFWFVKFVTALD